MEVLCPHLRCGMKTSSQLAIVPGSLRAEGAGDPGQGRVVTALHMSGWAPPPMWEPTPSAVDGEDDRYSLNASKELLLSTLSQPIPDCPRTAGHPSLYTVLPLV